MWRKASLEVTVTLSTYVRWAWSSGLSGPSHLLTVGSDGLSSTTPMSSMSERPPGCGCCSTRKDARSGQPVLMQADWRST